MAAHGRRALRRRHPELSPAGPAPWRRPGQAVTPPPGQRRPLVEPGGNGAVPLQSVDAALDRVPGLGLAVESRRPAPALPRR